MINQTKSVSIILIKSRPNLLQYFKTKTNSKVEEAQSTTKLKQMENPSKICTAIPQRTQY